ncbi:MAG: hypothetical protein MK066_03970 [Crocinitomicaceae bacterium]|nr:hypothetical protein [Crocinitomicaceae bacterium]
MRYLSICFFLIVFNSVFAQLPSKANKLVGVWKYKEGSGYEIWKSQGDVLIGEAYRVNKKTGDSSKVEDMVLSRVNANLIYKMETFNHLNDSVFVTTHNFVGGKRKLNFTNIDAITPYSIQYSLGLFNKNKMKIRIHYSRNDKGLKLILFKTEE